MLAVAAVKATSVSIETPAGAAGYDLQ